MMEINKPFITVIIQVMISKELREVAEECVKFLNSQKFVRCVVKCLNQEMDAHLLSSVCLICHSLMLQQHISIHRLRFVSSISIHVVINIHRNECKENMIDSDTKSESQLENL